MKPDILIFMSDQHSPTFSSYQGGVAKTPNLEQLCTDGTTFNRAYTSCPLCVPARLSMITGKLPHKTGIFSNKGVLSESEATYLHNLVQAGYETVLIGRMHFIGSDQRHGFTKRLVGDITTTTYNRPASIDQERGVFKNCFAEKQCTDVIGGGNSPVLEYDKEVIKAAKEYLSLEHDKPQCIVVSLYAPHFPYVAPEELYTKYKKNMCVPDSFTRKYNYLSPLLRKHIKNVDEDVVIKARSSYFGMIELVDRYVGEIRKVFDIMLKRNNTQGIFAYISDHGDQVGDRKMFGKRTFFESSVKIPLIFQGVGIEKNQIINSPVSIMDLFPTLCELAGIQDSNSEADGISLAAQLRGISPNDNRIVFSQLIETYNNKRYLGRMAVRGDYKYINYSGFDNSDLLFDLSKDSEEIDNLVSEFPEKVKTCKEQLNQLGDYESIIRKHVNYIASFDLISNWEKRVLVTEKERWINTVQSAKAPPLIE